MGREVIKSVARQMLARAYDTTRHYLTRLKGKVIILAYHRILPENALRQNGAVQAGMYVHRDVFERQVLFLKKFFSVLSFGDLLNHWRGKSLDPEKRYCVITFDDGWLDNYLHAFPILRRLEVPATIFLPTSLIGTDQWFWPDKLMYLLNRCFDPRVRESDQESIRCLMTRYPWLPSLDRGKADTETIIEACKDQTSETIQNFLDAASGVFGFEFPKDRVLVDWREVEEMSRYGISFGSHSCTHKILTAIPIVDVEKELVWSLQALRTKSLNMLPVVAYPNGNYNRDIIERVKAAGFVAAVTTRFGFEGCSSTDLFQLKRVGVHHDISATLPLFSFHIAGGNQFLANL
jgi:peptidoglycan/xylan/chitin deacetylase (PgdA/CDA1 family)